jgi:hypothetical protein
VLKEDELMQEWIGVCNTEFFLAAAKTVDAMVKYPGSQEPTEAGFSLAHGPGLPLFAILGQDPARAKRMGMAMASLTEGEGYELNYLVDGYPWGELGDGVVVDVSISPLLAFQMLTSNRSGDRLASPV